mmetsp:Transcript_8068/g.23119  ORF Transcript_8068/g.23119 Transcript_8068/m.23119 type:complete len:891 (+) Transcript_8068:228-2900(+)
MKGLWNKTGDTAYATTWLKGVADEAASKLKQQREALIATAKTSILSTGENASEGGTEPKAGGPDEPKLPTIKEPPKKDQQYLRLPVDSAKKLRFYDKADLDALISAQTKEKDVLFRTCDALQRLLRQSGMNDEEIGSEMEEILYEKNCLESYEDGVNATLLVSAQEEIKSLRAAAGSIKEDIISLQHENAELHEQLAKAAVQRPPAAAPAAIHRPREPLLRTRTEVLLEVVSGWEDEETVAVEILAEGTPIEIDEDHGLDAAAIAELQIEVDSLRASLEAERSKSAALVGKLARLEEEKRTLIENLSSDAVGGSPTKDHDVTQEKVVELQGRLAAAKEAAATAAQQAAQMETQLRRQEDEAEKKLAELRIKVSQAGQQQSEMLRRAQDICMEAEERADAAERKTTKAESRVTQLESEMREMKTKIREVEKDLKRVEKDKDKAEARAEAAENAVTEASMKGHVEAQAGASVRNHLAGVRRAAEEKEAELRKQMAEKEATAEEELSKLRDRASELEDEVASLTAQVSRAQAEMEAWERRIKEADDREAALLSDLREAEAVGMERDMLSVRVNALEEKLKESRTDRGQLDNYKQVARELENSKARAEEELMATARIVTGLEGRLRAANRESHECRMAMEAAEKRTIELERRMEEEVKARVAASGADKTSWPREAQVEVARLEQKAEAVQNMLATIEEQLESETKARLSDSRHSAMLRKRVSELEAASIRQEREAGDRLRLLERDLRLARDEADECRRIVSEVEEEHLALQERSKPKVKDENGLYRNRGGGSLYGASDEEMATNKANGDDEAVASEADKRPELKGVDIVYLKNVVLKFVEASVRQDAVQRDALIPAIATLVQATPQEFRALQQVSVHVAEQEQAGWYSYFGVSK